MSSSLCKYIADLNVKIISTISNLVKYLYDDDDDLWISNHKSKIVNEWNSNSSIWSIHNFMFGFTTFIIMPVIFWRRRFSDWKPCWVVFMGNFLIKCAVRFKMFNILFYEIAFISNHSWLYTNWFANDTTSFNI